MVREPRSPWALVSGSRPLLSIRRHRWLLVLLGLIALGPGPTNLAAEPVADLDLRYTVSWAGFEIASLALRHDVQPERYRSVLTIATVGLLETLLRYRAEAVAQGGRRASGELVPTLYRSAYQSRRKSRRVHVAFDPASGDVVSLEITKRGRPDRTKVPRRLQTGVIDPLTAVLQVRELIAGGAKGPFRAQVFDGRRRFDLEARIEGRDRVRIAGREWSALRIGLELAFLAGSNTDDLEDAAADNDQVALELLLSDDPRLLPLRLQTRDAAFAGRIELQRDCATEAGCASAGPTLTPPAGSPPPSP